MAGSASNYLELELLDHVLGGADYVRPGTVYVGLYTANPTDAGGGTEATGGSYARVSVANNATNWPAASGGAKSNGTSIAFPAATAAWGTVIAVGIFDAASGGNLLLWGDLLGPEKIVESSDASTDIITSTAHGFVSGTPVKFDPAGGQLPTGISAGVVHYVRDVTANTFKVSLTLGGTAVNITVAGVGGIVQEDRSKAVANGDTVSFPAGALSIGHD